MPLLHTVKCGASAGAVFYALPAGVRHCIICILHVVVMQTPINRALVPQYMYRNVSAIVNLRVVGKPCQTSCTACATMVKSCSAVTLCILHFTGGFPHSIRSPLSVPALGALLLCCLCMCRVQSDLDNPAFFNPEPLISDSVL